MLKKLFQHVSSRLLLAIASATFGAIVCLLQPKPPPATVDGIAELLSEVTNGTVIATDFIWEPSGGFLRDATWGRPVLFLSKVEEQTHRDLYRARVRLSGEGQPLGVIGVRNLTQTPLGDEHALIANHRYLAYLTRAFDVIQGATILDLAAEANPSTAWYQRLLNGAESWLQNGSTRRIGRTEVVFERPPATAILELLPDRLIMALGEPAQAVALTLSNANLNPGPSNPTLAQAWVLPSRNPSAGQIARDWLRVILGTHSADTTAPVLDPPPALTAHAASETETRSEPASASAPSLSWPPTALLPPILPKQEGEGQWWASTIDGFVTKFRPSSSGLSSLYQTHIRPDPKQPNDTVHLVAIDTRQLSLKLAAGFDEPRPDTGPRGRGRIADIDRQRTIAAFNGTHQGHHGHHGMVVRRRLLTPPQLGATTVAIDAHHRTFMGDWRERIPLKPHWLSLRQSDQALIVDGKLNPQEQNAAGSENHRIERSALGLTQHGYLIYAWGSNLSAKALAAALLLANCQYAVPLGLDATRVGFAFLNLKEGSERSRLLKPEMSADPQAYVSASAKDFFYLVLRDLAPKNTDWIHWRPSIKSQPPPKWLPAIYQASSTYFDTQVTLYAFLPERFNWRLVPGRRELAAATSDGRLKPAEEQRAAVAIGLGIALRKHNRRGLALNGITYLPMRPHRGLLKVGEDDGLLSVGYTPNGPYSPHQASELLVLAEKRTLRSEARALGAMRKRSAACALADDTFIVAEATADNLEPICLALLDAGCEHIFALDRGKQANAYVKFAETDAPLAGQYKETTLFALATEAKGTAQLLKK